MKYNYIYIIRNKLNHKFYIGKHSTNDLNDRYMGSGKIIRLAIKKYGVENFTKEILCFCDTPDEALYVEQFLVTEYLIHREDCYNANIGGKGGSIKGRKLSDNTRKRISEALIGNTYGHGGKGKPKTEEHKRKISEGNKGKILSDSCKAKISEANKGKLSGEKNPMFGKTHSDEAKLKISLARRGKTPWNKGLRYTIKNKTDIQNG